MNILEAIEELKKGKNVKCKIFLSDGRWNEIELQSYEYLKKVETNFLNMKHILSQEWEIAN